LIEVNVGRDEKLNVQILTESNSVFNIDVKKIVKPLFLWKLESKNHFLLAFNTK